MRCANSLFFTVDRRFVTATKEGDLSMLKKYVPLFLISNSFLFLLDRLLSEGTEINSRHLLGWSALHAAVMNNQLK